MTKEAYIDAVNQWDSQCRESGIAYGYPECCINEFVTLPPNYLNNLKLSLRNKLQLEAAKDNGTYTGFIPCAFHAVQIVQGKITLESLINKKTRVVPEPFPNDWSHK